MKNAPRQATAAPYSPRSDGDAMRASSRARGQELCAGNCRTALRWASASMSAALLAMPALAVTVGIGQTVEITSNTSFGSLTMDGGMLRMSAPTSTSLSLSASNAVLARGMIYNAYTQGPVSTFTLLGTTLVPGAAAGAPPADGMYLNASYFDSTGLDVINKGTLLQTGTGELTLLGRTRLINDTGATFSIGNDNGLKEFTGGSLNIVSFLNKGTFQKSGTSGTSDILVPFDQQGAQVLLSSGILSFARGGTHDLSVFDADAARTGHAGSIRFGGAHTFDRVTTLAGAFSLDGGSISVNGGNGWLQKGDFYSQGTIKIDAGSNLNNAGKLYLNSGSVAISAPTALLSAATLTNSGLMRLDGSTGITNDGNIVNSGLLRLQGSSSIAINSGATLLNSGTLWALDTSRVTINGGGVLRNSGDMVASSTLVGTGKLENQAGGTFQGDIFAAGSSVITVRNEGQFTVGRDNTVSVGQFDNVAGTLTVDGRLDVLGGAGHQLSLLGGTLNGNGAINGDVFVGGGPGTAHFTPGHSPGSMTINGSFSLLSGGVLELEAVNVNGVVEADQLIVNGNALLAGHVSFLIGAGVTLEDLPDALLTCFFNCVFSYDSTFSYDFPGRPGSRIELLDSEIRIVALGELVDVAPVPEPATVMTMLAGVGAIGLVVRRRKVRRS